MKTTKTLAQMVAEHPEFVYLGKTYRCSAASGDWLYLDNRNQWRVVPKTWTHILRELPYMEKLEIETAHVRVCEDEGCDHQPMVEALRVVVVGPSASTVGPLTAALKAGGIEVLKGDEVGFSVSNETPFNGQYYPLVTFDECIDAKPWYGPGERSRIRRQLNRKVNQLRAKVRKMNTSLTSLANKLIGTF